MIKIIVTDTDNATLDEYEIINDMKDKGVSPVQMSNNLRNFVEHRFEVKENCE
jgi:hypothetical protein|tara:strand:- start:912 stop:1070 length:159 start_codon:yes stop_codon:yes gene_type:complete